MVNPRCFLLLAAFLSLAATLPAQSLTQPRERLVLPSGEVLLGTVVAEDAETITFESDALGRVRVRRSPDLVREPLPAREPLVLAPTAPAPVESAAPARPAARWTRKLEAGLSLNERGESVSAYAALLRGELKREQGPNLLHAKVRYLIGVLNDQRSDDRLDASLAFHHLRDDRLLLRSELAYRFDRIRQISNDLEATAGCELRCWKSDALECWIGPGLTLNYSEPELGENGYHLLGDVRSRLTLQLGPRVRLEHQGAYLFNFNDLAEYRLRLQEGLRTQVSEHLTLGLRYEYEFESTRPVADERSDHKLFTTAELSY